MRQAKFVDVHTHLTHSRFNEDRWEILEETRRLGFGAVVVNGLEPHSNRMILDMAAKYTHVKPALGIYPVDAVNGMLPEDFPHRVQKFEVDAEIGFISDCAEQGKLAAIGECGLDGHWLDARTFAEQERVFCELIAIAKQHRLPIIIHTRKLEKRAADILKEQQAELVNFHCFGGRSKYAVQWAEEFGWCFSIPANARKNESFSKMLKLLPPERILTETDAPYLAPQRGERNTPVNVIETVTYLGELRGMTSEEAKALVWQNYVRLFEQRSL